MRLHLAIIALLAVVAVVVAAAFGTRLAFVMAGLFVVLHVALTSIFHRQILASRRAIVAGNTAVAIMMAGAVFVVSFVWTAEHHIRAVKAQDGGLPKP